MSYKHVLLDRHFASGDGIEEDAPLDYIALRNRDALRAWHERLGTLERDVTVKSGQDETINFIYRLPASPASPQAAIPPAPAFAAAG